MIVLWFRYIKFHLKLRSIHLWLKSWRSYCLDFLAEEIWTRFQTLKCCYSMMHLSDILRGCEWNLHLEAMNSVGIPGTITDKLLTSKLLTPRVSYFSPWIPGIVYHSHVIPYGSTDFNTRKISMRLHLISWQHKSRRERKIQSIRRIPFTMAFLFAIIPGLIKIN